MAITCSRRRSLLQSSSRIFSSSRRSQLANALDAGADRCTSPSAAAAALALRRPCFLALVVGPSSLDPQEVGKRRSSQQQTAVLCTRDGAAATTGQSREEKEMESR
uniref:Uncharacterized protein n=1 Tax=Oryza glumipatula TaxID=40148 RepID=A0A0D9YXV5_9ORYZ